MQFFPHYSRLCQCTSETGGEAGQRIRSEAVTQPRRLQKEKGSYLKQHTILTENETTIGITLLLLYTVPH